jgi:hypothetical protein
MEQTTDYCYNCDATKSLQLSSSYPNALLSISLLVSNNIDSSSKLVVHNCFENVFVIFADNRVEVAKSNFSRWRIAHNYNPNRKAITMIELQKMFFLYRV